MIAPTTVFTRAPRTETRRFFSAQGNAPSALERKNCQNVIVVRMLRQAHVRVGADCGNISNTRGRRPNSASDCTTRNYVSTLSSDSIKLIISNKHREGDLIADCSGTSSKELAYKKVSQYAPNLQSDSFVVLHRADGCRQLYDDARVKGSIDRARQSKGGAHGCGTQLRRFSEQTWIETQRWWE